MTKFIGEKILMRIFIGESDKIGHRPLYEVEVVDSQEKIDAVMPEIKVTP